MPAVTGRNAQNSERANRSGKSVPVPNHLKTPDIGVGGGARKRVKGHATINVFGDHLLLDRIKMRSDQSLTWGTIVLEE